MRILVFGASITQGFWDTQGGWVARLRRHYDQEQLKDLKRNNEPVIFNLGISGDTVQGLLARFKQETQARKVPDMAFVFSIGTNNAATGMERAYDPEEFEDGLDEIIRQATTFSDKIMVVGLPSCDESMTTPVFWRDVYYTNERIKTIEQKAGRVAKRHNTTFVPIFNEFKKHIDNREKILADGLHPNDAGHELIYKLVLPELEKLLS